ncbi:DNA primase [Heliomicrobium modesticaldum Ice1]|uniref:DNA primase n=1 Tax=Heliobacterium modesticaldum (strain ATCC 51547 / Ice1) TaxID=498761 RepID=B0TG56_HELMI|nr:DNA primase [Heliomicrobium modesticaldum]ABZ84552.1 DNA primase [Heliomicrobium modesticaldum Ice1]
MRDPQIVDEIRHRLDIVEIVADYVALKRQGGRYVGLCPFHSEKTPSFTVSRDKQYFHCFGCGTGGDVFTFVMLRENLTFPEALKKLAERAGVTLPERKLTPTQQAQRTAVERGRALHKRAAELYFRCLREDARARPGREYLSRRGVSDSVAVDFGLGFAPPGWEFLATRLQQEGYLPEELERFGLIVPRQGGEGYYDRFRNRIIFPIFDAQGRPVAFGGRVLDDAVPKYLNSPETPLYKKGQHLYGLNKAGSAIREKGVAVLVEGYMDVIACHQHGIRQAVASLGTAMTPEQGRLLLRYGPRVLICYDSDRAGVEAAVKAGGILTALGAQIQVLTLPEGKDPDEYLQRHGADSFWLAAEQAPSFFTFCYSRAAAAQDLSSAVGKASVVRELASLLLTMPSAVEQEANIQWLARELRLSEAAVMEEIRGYARNARAPGMRKENIRHTISASAPAWGDGDAGTQAAPGDAGAADGLTARSAGGGEQRQHSANRKEQAWRYLLYWMIEDPDRVRWVFERLGEEIPRADEPLGEILAALTAVCDEGGRGSLAGRVAERLSTDKAKGYLSALLVEDILCREPVIEDCINTLRYGWLTEEIASLESQVDAFSRSGDMEAMQRLLPRLAKLQQARNRAARRQGAMPFGGRLDQRPWYKGGNHG